MLVILSVSFNLKAYYFGSCLLMPARSMFCISKNIHHDFHADSILLALHKHRSLVQIYFILKKRISDGTWMPHLISYISVWVHALTHNVVNGTSSKN